MTTSFTDWESGLYLAHHGIKGQKWGVRNYQNPDGTLTAAGRARYGSGEGGSKRMSRQYNRQLKKFNRLKARADINTQKANAEKYDRRARKAAKIGNVAAGLAGSAALEQYGLGRLSTYLGKTTDESGHRENRRINEILNKAIDKQDSHSALAREGLISKGYQKILDNEVADKYEAGKRAIQNEERQFRIGQNRKIGIADAIRKIDTGVAYASAGTAAVSYGTAAVNKIMARVARKRTTEIGHSKAVARVKAQAAKMEKMFANTPYEALLKNNSGNKKNKARPNGKRH